MKRLIYIKSAKTGGTSLKNLLRKNSDDVPFYRFPCDIENADKVKKYKIIILANKPTIVKFKKKYGEVFNEAVKIVVIRDPYKRILSSYNYINNGELLLDLLKNPPKGPTGDTPENYKHDFVHFTMTQVDAMDITKKIINDPKYKIILFKNLFKETDTALKSLKFKYTKPEHLNTSNYKRKIIKAVEKKEIDKLFKKDIEFYSAVKAGRGKV